ETMDDVATSELLRDVIVYHETKADKQKAKEIADHLIKSGFAEPSKSKIDKQRGIVTQVGPVVAESVLDFFESNTGKKFLQRMKQLAIEPKSEKVSAKKMSELP